MELLLHGPRRLTNVLKMKSDPEKLDVDQDCTDYFIVSFRLTSFFKDVSRMTQTVWEQLRKSHIIDLHRWGNGADRV